jgi:hypothetical protein
MGIWMSVWMSIRMIAWPDDASRSIDSGGAIDDSVRVADKQHHRNRGKQDSLHLLLLY